MAISFAGAGAIAYSGVPPVSGLSQCSIVARIAGNSSTNNFGYVLDISDAGNINTVALLRNGAHSELFTCFRNLNGASAAFPFAFDGVMRSVVARFDGAASPKCSAFVDGVSQTFTLDNHVNTTIGSSQVNCSIGGLPSLRWNGIIAELAVYNRLITADEANAHSKGVSCLHFPRGLIFYAPLIREVHDIVGGLTGTPSGTTVTEHTRIYL